MITNAELADIKQRAEKATSGPWYTPMRIIMGGGGYVANTSRIVDAEFIAHAREDVPKMVAEVERLKTAIKYAIEITMDDDAWDYLQNVLQGTEQNAHIFKIGGA